MIDSNNSNEKACEEEVDETHLLDQNPKVFELDRDNECGYLCVRGSKLERLANAKLFVTIYGFAGATVTSSLSYFNAIITTIEKRYRMPSRVTGVIGSGIEVASIIMAPILGQLLTSSHRPRWVAAVAFLSGFFCFLNVFLHIFTGSGENALSLTLEYGTKFHENGTKEIEQDSEIRSLCQQNATTNNKCTSTNDFGVGPPLYLFIAHLVLGVYISVHDGLGSAFIDDNLKKSQAPVYLSFAFFLRMLGPAFAYTVALFSLKLYISPDLTPTITPNDPRWLGAWWLGWIIIGIVCFALGFLLTLFPRELPKTAIRRKSKIRGRDATIVSTSVSDEKSFISELLGSYKKFFTNKVVLYNLLSGIAHIFSAFPFWIFASKYIEIQYKQSASTANLLTGPIGLVFTAMGTFLSGFVLARYKLRARQIAFWNVMVGIISCCIMFAYVTLGCKENDNSTILTQSTGINGSETCISNCNCDFVNFNPVCGQNGKTYISPCHAGCTQETLTKNRTIIYENCSCISSTNQNGEFATPGSCPVNCDTELLYFMILMCINNLLVASARTNSILITIRSINPLDKTVFFALGCTFISLLAMIPSPIFFGWVIDQSCLVWETFCSGTGNCWLYDSERMRYSICLIAAGVITIGTIMDFGEFQSVKNVVMFDDDETVLNSKNKIIELDVLMSSNVEKKIVQDSRENKGNLN